MSAACAARGAGERVAAESTGVRTDVVQCEAERARVLEDRLRVRGGEGVPQAARRARARGAARLEPVQPLQDLSVSDGRERGGAHRQGRADVAQHLHQCVRVSLPLALLVRREDLRDARKQVLALVAPLQGRWRARAIREARREEREELVPKDLDAAAVEGHVRRLDQQGAGRL